jgi:hypothetical protein
MCFSPTASFAMSGVLAGIGAASVGANASRSHRMLAAIPLLFAAQQAAEGAVWLTVGDAGWPTVQKLAVDAFLGFAVAVWPVWLPVSLARAERDERRRRILRGLSAVGALFAVCAAALLTHWQPWARVANHSIAYEYEYGRNVPVQIFCLCAYVVPAVVPFFVSTARLARVLGAALVGSMGVAFILQRVALPSVWCFMAAVLSALVFFAVPKRTATPRPA